MKIDSIKVTVLALLFAATAFHSCEKEQSIHSSSEQKETLALKSDYNIIDCNTACLQDGPFIQENESSLVSWGPSVTTSDVPPMVLHAHNRYFISYVSHDSEKLYIEIDGYGYQEHWIKVNGQGGPKYYYDATLYENYPFSNVLLTINDNDFNISMDDPATPDIIETATSYSGEYLLNDLFTNGWGQCQAIEYQITIRGGGQPVELPEPAIYEMIGICTSVSLSASPSANVCPGTEVTLTATVSSTLGSVTGGAIKLNEIIGQEVTIIASQSVSSSEHSVTFNYIPENSSSRVFFASYDGMGGNGYNPSESEQLIVTSQPCCNTDLTGQPVLCGTDRKAAFIFTNQGNIEYVKIHGGIIDITGSGNAGVMLNNVPVIFDFVEYLFNDDILYTGVNIEGYTVKQLIPANEPNRYISVEGPASCTPLQIEITWISSGSPGNITTGWTVEDENGNVLDSETPLYCL